MSSELDKARGAMEHARDLAATQDRNNLGKFASTAVDVEFMEALRIAEVNSWIAIAAALEQLALHFG